MARPPASRILAAVASTSAARSTQTTAAPSRAKIRDVARPMPLAAPVTTVERPSSRPIVSSLVQTVVGNVFGPGVRRVKPRRPASAAFAGADGRPAAVLARP